MKILKVFTALIWLVAVCVAPAHAQGPSLNLIPELKSKTPEEKERDERMQKAYKDSLRKIPDAKGSSDPWGTMRSTEAPKPAAPARSRTKTGSTAN